MDTFKEFLYEGIANAIEKDFNLEPQHFTDYFKYQHEKQKDSSGFKKEENSESVTGEHHIYTQRFTDEHNNLPSVGHAWVNKKTGIVDLSVTANIKEGDKKAKRDTVYSNLDLVGVGGKGIAHHAYYDLMRRGIVLSHGNQSKGAIIVARKVRKTYPDVVAHTYDPETGEAKHFTGGRNVNVALHPNYKGKLYDRLKRIKYVQYVSPKNRLDNT